MTQSPEIVRGALMCGCSPLGPCRVALPVWRLGDEIRLVRHIWVNSDPATTERVLAEYLLSLLPDELVEQRIASVNFPGRRRPALWLQVFCSKCRARRKAGEQAWCKHCFREYDRVKRLKRRGGP